MAKTDFDDFIQRQNAKEQAHISLNVDEELKEWRDYLAKLYRRVEKYMAAYLADSRATVSYRQIELNEEFSGPYHVDQMSLKIGPSVILFKPVGTMLIGSKGRVDVQGPHGGARLVLINRKLDKAQQIIRVSTAVRGISDITLGEQAVEPVEWAWKLATPPPNIRFIDLDEQTFFDMVLSVADA